MYFSKRFNFTAVSILAKFLVQINFEFLYWNICIFYRNIKFKYQ